MNEAELTTKEAEEAVGDAKQNANDANTIANDAKLKSKNLVQVFIKIFFNFYYIFLGI